MKEDLERLISLQEIDAAILQKSAIIEAIPRKISTVEQPLKDALALYDKQKQKCDALAKKKKDKEAALADIQEKIKKLKTRTTDIKTNKEYQAHLKEIASAEKELSTVEDDILSSMETLDGASRDLNEYSARVKDEQTRIEAFRKQLNGEVAEVEKELDGLRNRRKELASGLDAENYKLYFKLLEIKRGAAVVEARDEVCLGCNMNIPPQLFVELKKNDRIIQCPQCNRILFFRA